MRLINGARRERYVAEAPGRFRCELQMDDREWRYSLVGWGPTCAAAAAAALAPDELRKHPYPMPMIDDRNGGRYRHRNSYSEWSNG